VSFLAVNIVIYRFLHVGGSRSVFRISSHHTAIFFEQVDAFVLPVIFLCFRVALATQEMIFDNLVVNLFRFRPARDRDRHHLFLSKDALLRLMS